MSVEDTGKSKADQTLDDEWMRDGHSSKIPKEGDMVIAVMGVTGVGKSSFIQLLSDDNEIVIGHGLESATHEIGFHAAKVAGQRLWFMDSIGFDDTYKTDTECLEMIAFALADLYVRKTRLIGVLYLHRILDVRLGGSSMRNLRLFRSICGKEAFSSVTFVTTFWSEVEPAIGMRRESELRTNFWADFIQAGARTFQHDGSHESARRVVESVLRRQEEPTLLALQREIVDEHLLLSETAAGTELMTEQAKMRQKYEHEHEQMKKHYADAVREHDIAWQRDIDEIKREYEKKIEEMTRAREELQAARLPRRKTEQEAIQQRYLEDQLRFRYLLEAEQKDARRKQIEIDRETQRLRNLYSQQQVPVHARDPALSSSAHQDSYMASNQYQVHHSDRSTAYSPTSNKSDRASHPIFSKDWTDRNAEPAQDPSKNVANDTSSTWRFTETR